MKTRKNRKLSLLLCLILFEIILTSSHAYAKESFVSLAHQTMMYAIHIPQSINLTADTTSFSVWIEGNLPSVSTLKVSTDAHIEMKREKDDTYQKKANVKFEEVIYTQDELHHSQVNQTGEITFIEQKAGNYTGTMRFEIEPIEAYRIQYDIQGGSFTGSVPVVYESNKGITLPVPKKEHYEFMGWSNDTQTIDHVKELVIGTVGDQVLIAQWNPLQYLLTFDANGGTVSPASKRILYGSKYGALPIPTRNGWDFVGWYSAATGGTLIREETEMMGNTTIYAHWQEQVQKSISIYNMSHIPSGSVKRNVTIKCNGFDESQIQSAVWRGYVIEDCGGNPSIQVLHTTNTSAEVEISTRQPGDQVGLEVVVTLKDGTVLRAHTDWIFER